MLCYHITTGQCQEEAQHWCDDCCCSSCCHRCWCRCPRPRSCCCCQGQQAAATAQRQERHWIRQPGVSWQCSTGDRSLGAQMQSPPLSSFYDTSHESPSADIVEYTPALALSRSFRTLTRRPWGVAAGMGFCSACTETQSQSG